MCTAAMFVPVLDCVYMHTLTRLLLHQAAAIYTTPARAFFHMVLQKGLIRSPVDKVCIQGLYGERLGRR